MGLIALILQKLSSVYHITAERF